MESSKMPSANIAVKYLDAIEHYKIISSESTRSEIPYNVIFVRNGSKVGKSFIGIIENCSKRVWKNFKIIFQHFCRETIRSHMNYVHVQGDFNIFKIFSVSFNSYSEYFFNIIIFLIRATSMRNLWKGISKSKGSTKSSYNTFRGMERQI